MPRGRKKTEDGVTLNLYVERSAVERLNAYAEEREQTKTKALEDILHGGVDLLEQERPEPDWRSIRT